MNFKRKKPRTSVKWPKSPLKHARERGPGYWMSRWPAWHDLIYHRRPMRRRDERHIRDVMNGADPDAVCWELHKRPHKYYW